LVFYYIASNRSQYESLLSQLEDVQVFVDVIILPTTNLLINCNTSDSNNSCVHATFFPGSDLIICDNRHSSTEQVCSNDQSPSPLKLIVPEERSIGDTLSEKLPQLSLVRGTLTDVPVKAGMKFEKAMEYFL
jgi:hypothetical protein